MSPAEEKTPQGRVLGLYVSPREGASMRVVDEVFARAGRGLEGDRYARGTGRWSRGRWDELTLVGKEAVEGVGAALDRAVEPQELRRNVLIEGIRAEVLLGRRFRLGEALVEGLRPCDPCSYLEQLTGYDGLKASLRGRGGVRARILESGRVKVGATIKIVDSVVATD